MTKSGLDCVNLLILGAPKCGTTTLYDAFSTHPEIYMSPRKEPHYLSYVADNWPDWACRGEEEYRGLFANAEGKRRRGEGSTWYLYSPNAAKHIKEHLPADTKMIAMIRHPVDRAYSNFNFRIQLGAEKTLDFREALAMEPERRAKGADWDYHYMNAGMYGEQIERYLEHFSREQLMIGLFEDLVKKPDLFYKEALSFLEVDDSLPLPKMDMASNITHRPARPGLNNFMTSIKGLRKHARKIMPPSIKNKVHAFIQGEKAKPPKLDPDLRAELTKTFHADILKLEGLIDRDLSHWHS
ncbi:sulfotransferase [soil metagenome]